MRLTDAGKKFYLLVTYHRIH